MAQKTKNTTQNNINLSKPSTIIKHHRVRTFFASIFGIVAVGLIIASIMAIWLNRTLTDTNTYVKTVAPLASQPAVQNFLAQKTTESVFKKTPPQAFAPLFLKPADTRGKTVPQIQTAVKTAVNDSVLQFVSSPQFATLWRDTNRSAHQQFISQINSGSQELTINLQPAVVGAVTQLKTTKLAPLGAGIAAKPGTGIVHIKGDKFTKVHNFYNNVKTGTIGIVVATIVATVLCVLISVHHIKTFRRILLGTGILSLLMALTLRSSTTFNQGKGDPVEQAASAAIGKVLFHNLEIASLSIGIVCIAAFIASKLYSRRQAKA